MPLELLLPKPRKSLSSVQHFFHGKTILLFFYLLKIFFSYLFTLQTAHRAARSPISSIHPEDGGSKFFLKLYNFLLD
jgi:hypothetical protein